MIARAILADPSDLAVHWVWLPLFHYAQVPLVALGCTMQSVRWVNVVLSCLPPIMLFSYVRSTAKGGVAEIPGVAIALFASCAAAMSPIVMQMGTTAQPEPLFAVLMLAAAISFARRRSWATAAWLSLAVLLRYEAWPALAVVGAVLAWDHLRGTERGLRPWLSFIIPGMLILCWAAARRTVDDRWFAFVGQAHEFAAGALHERSALDHGIKGLFIDLAYYPVVVAWKVMGPMVVFVPFGIIRSARQQGVRFLVVLGACLGSISLSWVQRSSLGLDRHFVEVVPLYAAVASQGIVVAAEHIQARVARFWSRVTPVMGGRVIASVIAAGTLTALIAVLVPWMAVWRSSIMGGWPERQRLGAYLRSLPSDSVIFCDDATLEILSGIDRRRFDRHWVDSPPTWKLITAAARNRGVAYVATWREKFTGHEALGRVVFETGVDSAHPDTTGIGVMRVGAD